jgi:hypothetical protein
VTPASFRSLVSGAFHCKYILDSGFVRFIRLDLGDRVRERCVSEN